MGHGPRRHQSGLRPNKGVDLAHRHAMSLIHTKVHPLHLHPWMKSGSPLICPSRLHMDHEGEMRCDKHFHVQDEATNTGTNISSTWRPHLAGKVGSADPQVGRPTYPPRQALPKQVPAGLPPSAPATPSPRQPALPPPSSALLGIQAEAPKAWRSDSQRRSAPSAASSGWPRAEPQPICTKRRKRSGSSQQDR